MGGSISDFDVSGVQCRNHHRRRIDNAERASTKHQPMSAPLKRSHLGRLAADGSTGATAGGAECRCTVTLVQVEEGSYPVAYLWRNMGVFSPIVWEFSVGDNTLSVATFAALVCVVRVGPDRTISPRPACAIHPVIFCGASSTGQQFEMYVCL